MTILRRRFLLCNFRPSWVKLLLELEISRFRCLLNLKKRILKKHRNLFSLILLFLILYLTIPLGLFTLRPFLSMPTSSCCIPSSSTGESFSLLALICAWVVEHSWVVVVIGRGKIQIWLERWFSIVGVFLREAYLSVLSASHCLGVFWLHW